MGEEADEAMMFESFTTCRKLVTAIILVAGASILATAAGAQQVVVIVNGEPITALDIEQRTKLNQLSTHKTPARQEILDELINEKLKVKEAKKFGLEISSSEVDTAYASMASRMRITAEQLTEQLAKSGVNAATLKARIKAGRLTPPEVTKYGVEMFAICAKKESAADNTLVRRQARETVMAERYEQRSKQYLEEIRRGAMFEYK